MTTENILALQPGADLDQAVHVGVFGGVGKPGKFSTVDASGLRLLAQLPGLFVAHVDPRHPNYDPSRPWVAGRLSFNPQFRGDVTSLRVTAPTRLCALCKAALLMSYAGEIGKLRTVQVVRVPQPAIAIHAKEERPPIPVRPLRFNGPAAPEDARAPNA